MSTKAHPHRDEDIFTCSRKLVPFHRELNPSLGSWGLCQGKTTSSGVGGVLWRISGFAASTRNPAAPVCGDSHMDQVVVHSWGDGSASHSTGREGFGMNPLGQDGFGMEPDRSGWNWDDPVGTG